MNDELISRAAAIDLWEKYHPTIAVDAMQYDAELRQLPSERPEIVRCKDCKHKYLENLVWHCPFGLMGGENFFCGYGSLGRAERRTDEGD